VIIDCQQLDRVIDLEIHHGPARLALRGPAHLLDNTRLRISSGDRLSITGSGRAHRPVVQLSNARAA
jgi:hypothetical protein